MPQDDTAFRRWYAGWASKLGLNPNPDDPQQHYDYRLAFKNGWEPDASGHWPSDGKDEEHPNLIVGGFNVKTLDRVPGTNRLPLAGLVEQGWSPESAQALAARPEPQWLSTEQEMSAHKQSTLDRKALLAQMGVK